MVITTLTQGIRASLRRLRYGGKAPTSIGLLITYRCNLRCPFCRLPDAPPPEMSTEQILSIIGDFFKMGAFRLGISGGEPLLRQDIGEIIDTCRRWGMMVSVNTNGWCLSDFADRIANASLITVSLDGPEELHDRVRGEGAHARLCNGISCVQKRGIKTAAIIVITSQNLPALRRTLEEAANMGLRTYIQPVTNCDVSGELDSLLSPEPEAFRREIRWLIDNRHRFNMGSSPAFLQHLLRYPDFSNSFPCRAGDAFIYLTPDGKLTPCHVHFDRELPSALELGAARALQQVKRPDCSGCAICPYVEQSLIANYNFPSIWHALKSL